MSRKCSVCGETLIAYSRHMCAATPCPAASAWRTDEPPRDGTRFLAWYDNGERAEIISWQGKRFWAGGVVWERYDITAWAEINPYEADECKK